MSAIKSIIKDATKSQGRNRNDLIMDATKGTIGLVNNWLPDGGYWGLDNDDQLK